MRTKGAIKNHQSTERQNPIGSLSTTDEAIQLFTQQELKALRGKISWTGDLDEMRSHT